MFYIFVWIILVQCIYAEPPSCLSCKWVIPHPRGNIGYQLCGFYKNRYDIKGKETIIYEFASHCRSNESMCGNDGYMYEEANAKANDSPLAITEESQSKCSCESSAEMEQLEREMFEMFQKIKKHNTKQLYKTTKDLYKLFRSR